MKTLHSGKKPDTRNNVMYDSIYRVQDLTKLINNDRSQNSGYLSQMKAIISRKNTEKVSALLGIFKILADGGNHTST